jgi:hypothetical protein
MSVELAGLAPLVSTAAALLGLVALVVRASMRLARVEVKVDTMWAFQMRRAMSEAVTSGIGSLNSPIKFREEAVAALEPIRSDLVDFWARLPPRVRDAEAALLIEGRFGDEILQRICIPFKLSHGACLLLALAVAKQSNDLSLD